MEVAWEKGTALPVELEGFSCVSVTGTGIFAFGGLNSEGIEQNQVWHFSPTNDTWRQVKNFEIFHIIQIESFLLIMNYYL